MKKKGQEIWTKASHSKLHLFKRLCHLLHYLLSVHFARKSILNRAIGKIINNLFAVAGIILGWKGDYLLVEYFSPVFVVMLFSATYCVFLSPHSLVPDDLCWRINNYILELCCLSLGSQEKKRKPVNSDLCFSQRNNMQFAALPLVLFSFTLYFLIYNGASTNEIHY